MRVAVPDAIAQLHHKLANDTFTETMVREVRRRTLRESFASSAVAHRQRLHILFQIHIEELKDEVELVAVGMNDVEESYDVGVAHLLEQGDFPNGGAGNTLIFGFETNLLERYYASPVLEISSLVDDTVGAFSTLSVPLHAARNIVIAWDQNPGGSQAEDCAIERDRRMRSWTHLRRPFPASDSSPWWSVTT